MGSAERDERLGVVFVHGFTSSPKMWKPFTELMAGDPDLGFVRPLPFGYATKLVQLGPLKRIPSFDTVADSLKEYLDTEAEGYRRLALVGHSQGGLVIQRCLTRLLGEGRAGTWNGSGGWCSSPAPTPAPKWCSGCAAGCCAATRRRPSCGP